MNLLPEIFNQATARIVARRGDTPPPARLAPRPLRRVALEPIPIGS